MPNSAYYRSNARKALAGHWGTAILVMLVVNLLSGEYFSLGETFINNYARFFDTQGVLGKYVVFAAQIPVAVYIIIMVGGIALSGLVNLGQYAYFTDLIQGGNPTFSKMFALASFWGKALLLELYITLLTLLWSLLFVIPGIVAAYRYSMAFYILAKNPSKGVMECVAESKALMYGHKWRLFCLDFSFIGWRLLCLVTLGIGYLFVSPYETAARTSFFMDREGRGTFTENNYYEETPEFVINNGREQI